MEMSSSYSYEVNVTQMSIYTAHHRKKPGVADWGDGVSASCTVGPIAR